MAARKVAGRSGRPAWEDAYEKIKAKILSTELKPRQAVSEELLASQVGVSRTPVREAIRVLEQEGLIVTENRRKRIHLLRSHEIDEIFDIKKGIEGQIIHTAASRTTPEHVAAMNGILEAIERFAAARPFDELTRDHATIGEWLELDERFHGLLYEMARNPRAKQIVDNLNAQWHRMELGLLAMEGRLEQNVAEHLEMGSAVVAGDADRSRELIVAHLDRLQRTITGIMRAFQFPA